MFYRICFYLLLLSLLRTSFVYSAQNSWQEDQTVYKNWIDIQNDVTFDSTANQSIYDRLSDRFYSLFRSTGESIYLKYALYEAGKNKRQKILNNISASDRENIADHLKVLNGNINSNTYSIRPFSPDDLYLFLIVAIPDSSTDEAENLLDHWRENLDLKQQELSLSTAMKAQALIFGYNDLNQFKKIIEIAKPIIDSNPFPNSLFSFNLFETITFAARTSGYYSESLNIYEKILLPLADQLNSKHHYLRVRMNYALTLFRIGNVNASLNEFEKLYTENIQNLDPIYKTALFNNLAVSYLNTGQFDRYVQFQLEAFEIAQNEQNSEQQIEILRNLYIFYRRQNETELALNYLNQALDLSERYNLSGATSEVLLSLGVDKRKRENLPGEALQYFKDALKISGQTGNYQQLFNSYIELGETYHELGQTINSESYFHKAIELSSEREDQRNLTMAVVRYSNTLIDNEQISKAELLMHDISERNLNQIPFDLEVLGKNVTIKLLINQGETGQALEISSITVEEIFDWLADSADMQTGHMRMDEEFAEAFQLHTKLLHERGNFEEAITVTGRLRNLSRDGLFNNPLLKSQILTEEELIRDHNLSNRIQDLRSRYANATDEQKVYLGNQLASANAERSNLLNQAFPNYSSSDFEDVLPQVMDELNSDQVILYFSVFDNQVFQFLITSNGVNMNVHPANNQQMKLLENTVQSFGQNSTDLNLLYDIYMKYFADMIPSGINHIYMIPDGIFYRIPIEILPVEPTHSSYAYGSSRYLIEDYSVSYLNTLTDLVNQSTNTNYNYDIAGFGVSDFTEAGHPNLPDLPFSPYEVTNSVNQLNKFRNKEFYINNQSTERNFRSIAGSAKIIHLATHSKVDDENPLFSSLYMYSEKELNTKDSTVNENDGIVYAYELFDLNLNADLIFLSSCESGSGGYLKGSGILGFSRAFAYAGAKSLSINLWPIRDQTASEISSQFYKSLNEGKNKAEALREAQLHYLNNSSSDPYLWGAYIIYGNIEPSVNNYHLLMYLLLSGLLLTGVGFIVIISLQKKALIRS